MTCFKEVQMNQDTSSESTFAPFADKEEWGLAEWLVNNLGQTPTDEFLKLSITQKRTQPSFHNNHSFLKKVDALPHGTAWHCEQVAVTGNQPCEDGTMMTEEVKLWAHDPVECIKDLISNPLFRDWMVYAPEQVYQDSAGTQRVIDNMWTADWWWQKQGELPEGATIAPVILASDKTSLSQFRGDKSAWPIYLYRLFHHCMSRLLQLLVKAGRIGVEMVCTDGCVHQIHPILAAYIADFPEQCLVACCKENRCPHCIVPADQCGELLQSALRDPESTYEALQIQKIGQHPPTFEEQGLCAVYKPFWADLPHSNIFAAFTLDLLHQVHKGVFKDHLVKWCLDIVGEKEIDARFKAMPDYPGLWHFKKGISMVKQWMGMEHKEMQRVFVGLLAGAVPALHTPESLAGLDCALAIFHANKQVLIDLDIHEHFNIPKIHQLTHYIYAIQQFGSANSFNSELPEQLHIYFRDYEEQMALWLQRQEAVYLRGLYLSWLHELSTAPSADYHIPPDLDSDSDNEAPMPPSHAPIASTTLASPTDPVPHTNITRTLAKSPAFAGVAAERIIENHGATDFLGSLTTFLQKHIPSMGFKPVLHNQFDVYRQVMITMPPNTHANEAARCFRIRATPAVKANPQSRKQGSPAKFDMALLSFKDAASPAAREGDLTGLSHSTHCLQHNVAVVHLDDIVRPCHLIPKWGPKINLEWTSDNVYELSQSFFFNHFIDLDAFCMSSGIT
ncbi:hypothetical protein DFH29DRAFT_979602 [Suillus ampliporus]|nr:hypothetical protein DFH29DRAFT_979602 [Suillus ampliporus]